MGQYTDFWLRKNTVAGQVLRDKPDSEWFP